MSLDTRYIGLKLKNPLVVGASPLSESTETVQRLEEAGAAAIVMYSLFEEQIRFTEVGGELESDAYGSAFAETVYSGPGEAILDHGADSYIEHLAALKEAVSIPVIGSFNGSREGSWVEYARLIEQAGADALELNLYFLPVDPAETSVSLEERCLRIVETVRSEVGIPLAVKLSPCYAALPHFVSRLGEVGADGVVVFNRFYQPDIDLETMAYNSVLSLSTSAELPARLRMLAILHGRVDVDLAVSGGVHSGADVIKAILSGASAVQLVAAVLKDGPGAISRILGEVEEWMKKKELFSMEPICGSMSLTHCAQPDAIERANYLRVLKSWHPPRGK